MLHHIFSEKKVLSGNSLKTVNVKQVLSSACHTIKNKKYSRYVGIYGVFLLMFFLGRYTARFMQEYTAVFQVVLESENWGTGFNDIPEGGQPVGNVSAEELKKYDAYYLGSADEKVIYLTFDCGYENGYTDAILDALKQHNVPATFFVVGHYVTSAPEQVKRMVADGHTVGNHTYHHPDMSAISDMSAFKKEMDDVANAFKELTGTEMAMYYRPPQGKYNTNNLQMAKELGYSTFFWSLAHVDWDVNKQPSREKAMEKLTKRIHPGAIVLLHNTSQTNSEILDELLTKWKEMGYTFGTLEELRTTS